MTTLLYDVETDGLLKTLTRVHLLVIQDADTKEITVYRQNDEMNTIEDGVRRLMDADVIGGHNILRFDELALKKCYPWYAPKGRIVDTLVLVRVLHANIKERDFALNRRGVLPGQLIGSHSLDSWGYRLGLSKGDYSKKMVAMGLDPWASWNQEMEDYCIRDVEITAILWAGLMKDLEKWSGWDPSMEQDIHDLLGYCERQGFPFAVAEARKLANHLEAEQSRLIAQVKSRYGFWYAPEKKKIIRNPWEGAPSPEKPKPYAKPNTEWGEDDSRAVWAEMTFPKIDRKSAKLGDLTKGAPFCKIVRKDFNPASRAHIVDRFTLIHQWQPEDFTETGQPSVDDAVLRKLSDRIPEAEVLADILFHQKILGQVSNGAGSWLNTVEEDGRSHCYYNTGGTVTGRCSHIGPNLGQVPAVMTRKINNVKTVLKGREGEYGFECRSLFYVPPPWKQVGVDLSGLEFRCLAEQCVPYDNGALIDVVLNGDIHQINMDSTGIADRDVIKRVIYGMLYGAGDLKIGIIVQPFWSPDQQRALGKKIRDQLMRGLPALAKAIDAVKTQASKGYLVGLDGRPLFVRSEHAAFNMRLQSDGAMISKKWVLLAEQYLLEHGLCHGWAGDFVLLAFVHDETQWACKPEYVDLVKAEVVRAARDAGKFFNFRCPIDAEAKVGRNWAETH